MGRVKTKNVFTQTTLGKAFGKKIKKSGKTG